MAIPVKKPVKPVGEDVNIGDLGIYVAGGGIQEGDYIWKSLDVRMHQATGRDGTPRGPERLGAMLGVVPISNPDAEEISQFYSFGTKAHESFSVNETGTGIRRIPDGANQPLSPSSNWSILLKSIYESGMPTGYFSGDVSVLVGMHVHMMQQPEPEERTTFRKNAGADDEFAQTFSGPRFISVVSEIKDSGKPWEGTGGVPASKPVLKGMKTVAISKAKPVPEPEPEPDEMDEETVLAATVSGLGTVLQKQKDGKCRLALLKVSAFSAIQKDFGDEIAQSSQTSFLNSTEQLGMILETLGYTVKGADVVRV